MNKENILLLADHLDDQTYFDVDEYGPDQPVPDFAFDMSTWMYRCEAPACIAGHAAYLSGKKGHPENQAIDWLGLTVNIGDQLFDPFCGPVGVCGLDPGHGRFAYWPSPESPATSVHSEPPVCYGISLPPKKSIGALNDPGTGNGSRLAPPKAG